jgi:hypothetical protein
MSGIDVISFCLLNLNTWNAYIKERREYVGKGRGSHSSEDARAHVISGQKRMEIELLDGTIPRRKMG